MTYKGQSMMDMKGIRSLRLPLRRHDAPENYHELLDGFLDVMQTVREAYPTVEPSPAFRDALHARLLAEAAWLKDHPVETPREAAMKRSAAAAAALLVLGFAALAWRSFRLQANPAVRRPAA